MAFALYILNFPQLIAGPIIRYRQIADQLPFRAARFEDVDAGMGRFTVGLVKKLMIADPIGSVVDQIFRVSPDQLTTELGVARCPLLRIANLFRLLRLHGHGDTGWRASSVSVSPRISIIPIAPRRCRISGGAGTSRFRRGSVTMSISHWAAIGAGLGSPRVICGSCSFSPALGTGRSWSFIVWGLWQGLFLWVERLEPVKAAFEKVPMVLRHCYLLLAVLFGWVFFSRP